MATPVLMPKQGQSVESCILIEWKKAVGDSIAEGETLCDVETDKATLEVESPASGTVLALLFDAGDEVPVLETIAWVGAAGEAVESTSVRQYVSTSVEGAVPEPTDYDSRITAQDPTSHVSRPKAQPTDAPTHQHTESPISPRARNLAGRKGVDATGLSGSGPEGRIIERDVQAALAAQPKLTPVAKAMVAEGGYSVPAQGMGAGGRITSHDLQAEDESVRQYVSASVEEPTHVSRLTSQTTDAPTHQDTVIPLKGVRKLIAERMLASLQTTAQLTLNGFADTRALQSLRTRFKESPEALGLRGITINDLVLFAVARALTQHPDLNATFADNAITQYGRVHLGMAVDTPRGLLVPVIHNADLLTLKQLSAEGKRLATAAQAGKSAPNDLAGGTFTVSNLGAFGVEHFTPVLNPPQVGILGVGGINLRPVQGASGVEFVPHIALSLTINHQVVDGAPGARFLQIVGATIAGIDLALAG